MRCAVLAALALATAGRGDEPVPGAARAPDVERHVAQLGAAEWADRDQAELALRCLGPSAVAALVRARYHPDPEIGRRADRTLRHVAPPAPAPEPLPADIGEGAQPGYRTVVTPQGRALVWLAAQQRPDGGWGTGADDAREVELTALVVTAFQTWGHTFRDGAYQRTVGRGIKFLYRRQTEDGGFGGTDRHARRGLVHATYAFAEAYAATHSPVLREPARRACARLVAERAPGYGWGLTQEGLVEPELDLWAYAALRCARDAELEVDGMTPAMEAQKAYYGQEPPDGADLDVATWIYGRILTRAPMALVSPWAARLEADLLEAAGPVDAPRVLGERDWRRLAILVDVGFRESDGWHGARFKRALAEVVRRQVAAGDAAGSFEAAGGAGARIVATALGAMSMPCYPRARLVDK